MSSPVSGVGGGAVALVSRDAGTRPHAPGKQINLVLISASTGPRMSFLWAFLLCWAFLWALYVRRGIHTWDVTTVDPCAPP